MCAWNPYYYVYMCMIVYRIGSGSWAAAGVATEDIRVIGNLTSFAVLVDVAGGLRVSCGTNFILSIYYTES